MQSQRRNQTTGHRRIAPRLAAACVLATLLLGAGRLVAEEWPRWRGPRGDGGWQAPPLPERWPAAGLAQRWKQPIGGGYAGVVVADGRAVALDRQTDPIEVERVLGFDAATGRPLWRHEYPVHYGNGPRAAATIDRGRVYTLGAMGQAVCLDAATGAVVWSRDCVAELSARIPEWGLAASPVVWRDLVILHVGAAPDGSFIALDRNTGIEKWRAVADPAGYATPIIAPHAGGEILIGWTPEHVVALDPADGRALWSVPYKVTYGVSIATPIVAQGLVFVTGYWEGSKAIRLGDTRDAAELAWEDDKALRGLMSQPLYRDGYVYSLDKRFGLTCFELATGKKFWDDGNTLTPRDRNPQASLVWLGDSDRIIALNAEGELVLARLTPAGYQEQDRTRIIGPTWAHPAYAGNSVFARDDKELVCVELPVGED